MLELYTGSRSGHPSWLAPRSSAKDAGPLRRSISWMPTEAWRKVWLKFEDVARAPWRGAQLQNCEPLPMITGECIAKVARTYKERTGLGCDDFHPRWFGWLSADLLSALAVLLTAIEGIGLGLRRYKGYWCP